MSTVTSQSGYYLSQVKLYSLAILVYAGIASLFIVPALHRSQTSQTVKTQLSDYVQNSKKQNSSSKSAALVISGAPTEISIARLGIKLPVAAGYYNLSSQKWTLDSKHVFTDNYTNRDPLIGTSQPNVTLFYGHDIPGILVNTSQITYGDILTINTTNGYRFKYFYTRSKVVAPTDASILTEKNKGEPVVLVTCTGTWYQSRRAMYFKLLDTQKITSEVQISRSSSL